MNANRRFYPKQVLRRLAGRAPDSLSLPEQAAFKFYLRRSRRYNVAIAVTGVDPFKQVSAELSAAILANATMRIFVKI